MMYFLLTIALAYTIMMVLMAVFQRTLMYFPDKAINAPAEYGLAGFEDITTVASDGTALQLWYRPAQPGYPTIVYFHGNAGHLGSRARVYSALVKPGFGLLALSYRGYGKSTGAPTEAGLYHDGRAAIAYLTDTLRIPLGRIILYGESLGTGVATQMATEFPVAMLALEAPYTSVANRAAEIYYYLPVKYLIRDQYDSLGKIIRVKAPFILFHGERDATIPVAHGRALLEIAPMPKKGFFFPLVGHNDFDSDLISSHLLDFAKEHHLIAP